MTWFHNTKWLISQRFNIMAFCMTWYYDAQLRLLTCLLPCLWSGWSLSGSESGAAQAVPLGPGHHMVESGGAEQVASVHQPA